MLRRRLRKRLDGAAAAAAATAAAATAAAAAAVALDGLRNSCAVRWLLQQACVGGGQPAPGGGYYFGPCSSSSSSSGPPPQVLPLPLSVDRLYLSPGAAPTPPSQIAVRTTMTTPMLVASARAPTPIANRRDDDNGHPDDGRDTGHDRSQHQLGSQRTRVDPA